MSVSRHPVALRLEELVGRNTALLATVMCLPLLDGIFAALVVGGALDTTAGILQIGLLIFGGSATVAVVLADFDGTAREGARTVLLVAVPLTALAAVQAAYAPVIESALNMSVFQRFAALVVIAVAASTASARIAEYVPRPAIIVVLGLVASLDLGNASLAASADLGMAARGAAAALVGVAFALALALASPWLRSLVDLDLFRFGSAVALGLLGVGLLPGAAEFGLLVSDWAPLIVLGLSALFAFDPARGASVPDVSTVLRSDDESGADGRAATDGGESGNDGSGDDLDQDRPPWL